MEQALMFRWVSWALSRSLHFWVKLASAVAVVFFGWVAGDIMFYMVAYTMFLSVTTDLQTIVSLHSSDEDTSEIKAQVSELGRAVPGARDVIDEQP